MKNIVIPIALLATSAFAGPKVKDCVSYAKSWEAAVAEAKMLNVPIVVHNHGFYCPPCWGMHSSVLQNRKYIKFAYENTVEVVAVSDLAKGIEAGDRKAETYGEKDAKGNEVKYLVEWPGLTVDDMKRLRASPAARYNDTGRIPHTAIVNPHTGERLAGWNGGSAGRIMKAVEEAQEVLEKQYGRRVSRKELERFRRYDADAREELAEGDLGKAWAAWKKLAKKAEEEPAAIRSIGETLAKDLAAATGKKLDELEAIAARGEAKAAERELRTLLRYVKDTPMEKRANELMAKLDPPDA